MQKKRKRMLMICSLIAIFLGMILWIIWGNTALMVHEITITNTKIPQTFHGYRIVQISDLHNSEFGDDNEILLEHIKDSKPDMIVLTGDLIDASHTNIDISLSFAKQAVMIAPTYFVSGNHEAAISSYGTLREGLQDAGVKLLSNDAASIEKDGEAIVLLGVDDPSFQQDFMMEDADIMESILTKLPIQQDTYTILLSHRPELMDTYVASGVDLVFSGHAHGGQFRLPLLGGIIAPNQGLFPTYDGGLYTQSSTQMVVSRGIGNSILPLRINNRPEIVAVTLQSS